MNSSPPNSWLRVDLRQTSGQPPSSGLESRGGDPGVEADPRSYFRRFVRFGARSSTPFRFGFGNQGRSDVSPLAGWATVCIRGSTSKSAGGDLAAGGAGRVSILLRRKLLALCSAVLVWALSSGTALAQPPQTGSGPPAGNLQSRMQKASSPCFRSGECRGQQRLSFRRFSTVAPNHGPANLHAWDRSRLRAWGSGCRSEAPARSRRVRTCGGPTWPGTFSVVPSSRLGRARGGVESPSARALENAPQFGPALLGRCAGQRSGSSDLEQAASDLDKARSLEGSAGPEAALLHGRSTS